MENYIPLNIKTLRENESFSQAAFSRLFDISKMTLGNYEKGVNPPSIDFILKICTKYNVSIDDFVKKDLRIEDYHTTEKARTPVNLYVPAVRQKDYLSGVFFRDEKTPPERLNVPRMNTIKNPRTFEVHDQSMKPILYKGDMLMTEKIENLSDVSGGQIYVIVTYLNGILIRWVNVDHKNKVFSLHPEEKTMLPTTIDFRDVREMWRAVGRVCFHFSDSDLGPRVKELEEFVEKIKDRFPDL